MWSKVGPVTLICEVSHDIKSVQDIIPEFNPNQQCHSFRNTGPVLNCYMAMDVSCVLLSSHANRHRHIQTSCYIKIFVYKHKVNRWQSTSHCQGWQRHECL